MKGARDETGGVVVEAKHLPVWVRFRKLLQVVDIKVTGPTGRVDEDGELVPALKVRRVPAHREAAFEDRGDSVLIIVPEGWRVRLLGPGDGDAVVSSFNSDACFAYGSEMEQRAMF